PRRAWTLLQTGAQPAQLVAASHGQHFHGAVAVVAYPPGDSQRVRLTLHKPAEAHALHASANNKAAGFGRFFSGSHFQIRYNDSTQPKICHSERSNQVRSRT